MMRIFRTENSVVHELKDIKELHHPGREGCWIEMTNPSSAEASRIELELGVDHDDVMAAIDPEEKNRVDLQEDYTLILVDIPSREVRHSKQRYTTIPLGLILTENHIVTVCSEETPILQYFHHNAVRGFSTKKKLRFVYQIMLRVSLSYQRALTVIDKARTEFEENIEKITEEADLISLHELESTLVYFATSLRGNANVLNKLARYGQLQQYPEDRELLDDVIIENQQAIEMTQIYRDIIDGTRQLISTLMDNRLNEVMKRLTSITLILAVPTMISGMYGMNVDTRWMPFANTFQGFWIIGAIIIVICIILLWILKRMKML
ncbi:MAG: magnesium transporter CorA family protein [[Clostridium] aminophilum]|uniref:magnesium transporter CorA family protein n=1 Tax=[Clostridium] aminophilum TaxID=1526 RepID=UPI0026EFE7C1|nr:magnesium transporter CorA family protein [[Clostridium] aminophilum]MDD6196645.1 magnesium transporter CorA family protein [[Clostridium] aminophilum]